MTRHIGGALYLLLIFAVVVFFAFLTIRFLIVALARPQRRFRDGLILGTLLAAGASFCWLTTPYIGGYPNLPGMILATALVNGSPIDTYREELLIHVTNFILWPTIGGLMFAALAVLDRICPEQSSIE